MHSGAAGWVYPQPEYWHFHRSNDQVTSARHQSHRVRRFPPESNFPPASNFLPRSKRPLDEPCYSPPAKRCSVTSEHDFDYFIEPERFKELAKISERFGKRYDGRMHGKYATSVKDYTASCKRPLNRHEQSRLTPCLPAFIPSEHWSWRSLTTVAHSFTASGIFTSRQFTDQAVMNAQSALLTGLLDAVCRRCEQITDATDIDAQGIANLLWAVAKMLDNGQRLTPEFKEAVAALLPHVIALGDQFIPQHLSNLLWATAKLMDNGHELTAQLKQVVATLLPRVNALKDRFAPQGVANLLWAMAKLVDYRHELTAQLKEVVAALLPRVNALKDQFSPQGVANLLWALAKLVDNGHELTTELNQTVVILLSQVRPLKFRFNPQEISNTLWAMAKLVDKGLALTLRLKELVPTLLPYMNALQDQFIAKEVASLLWALAKLVDNGQEMTPALKAFLVTLLPLVSALKEQFTPQHIVNLLWGVARLVDNDQELTPDLKETVDALLPLVHAQMAQFNTRGIANLLWAMAKLLINANVLVPELKASVAALLFYVRLRQVDFNPQEISTVLWAMGTFGELIDTTVPESVAQTILYEFDGYMLFTQQDLVISLWGLLACSARWYLNKNGTNSILECLISELFRCLERRVIDNEQGRTVMALAASWLGRKCPFDPHYLSRNSSTQFAFYTQLKSALPALTIEQEKSIHSLPPVDLLLPEHNIAIEIQGASHYVGHDFQTRNGSTLLKIALLQKAGYDVLEIPVNQLDNPDSVKTYIGQIQSKAR